MMKSRGRNAKATINTILEAAVAEFTEYGLTDGKIENIATRSGYSLQSIYHYFGSKENLYIEMLTKMAKNDVERASKIEFESMSPCRALEKFIDIVFESQRESGRLVIDQIQREGKQIRETNPMRESWKKYIEKLSTVIARGKEANIFDKNLDPEDIFLLIWITSLGATYFGPAASKMIDRDFVSEMSDGYWQRYVREFISRAVSIGS